ncbi:hypothetical protein [Halopseudomonas sp.]|uniref:hypothetical protein n=1 Tax=Halopseudomonas sp. TaxID=2901191 RepID=UPI0035681363
MHIEINAERSIQCDAALSLRVDELVRSRLAPFADRVIRVDAGLSDWCADIETDNVGKRCVLQAQLAGHEPVIADDTGETIEQATNNASKAMLEQLQHLASRKG